MSLAYILFSAVGWMFALYLAFKQRRLIRIHDEIMRIGRQAEESCAFWQENYDRLLQDVKNSKAEMEVRLEDLLEDEDDPSESWKKNSN